MNISIRKVPSRRSGSCRIELLASDTFCNCKNVVVAGDGNSEESQTANSGTLHSGGGWAIAQSPILGTTITVERLQKRGYISLADMYKQITATLSSKSNSLFPIS